MANKNNRSRKEQLWLQAGLSDSDRQLLQLKREDAIKELAARHDITEMVAGILLDAKLEELYAQKTLLEKQLRIRELLDDCYPDDDEDEENEQKD